MNFEKYREALIEKGIEPEKADEIIVEAQQKEEEERKIEENTLKVSEVAEILNRELDEMFNEPKVRRLMQKGELPAVQSPGKAKKLGYRIEKEDVDRFIQDRKMTREDWKAEALKYKALAEKSLLNDIEINPTYAKRDEDGVVTSFKLSSGTLKPWFAGNSMLTSIDVNGEIYYRDDNEDLFRQIEEKLQK